MGAVLCGKPANPGRGSVDFLRENFMDKASKRKAKENSVFIRT